MELIRLEPRQLAAALPAAVRAFQNDPFTRYIEPDDVRRPIVLGRMFPCVFRYGFYYGQVYSTSPELCDVAIWIPSEQVRDSLIQLIRVGFIWLPLTCGLTFYRRAKQLHEYMRAEWQVHAPRRYWHLQMLAVDPSCHGRGHGRRLLEPMLARADAEGIPCCLETTHEANLAFYARFGFTVLSGGTVPGTDVGCWLLKRDPR